MKKKSQLLILCALSYSPTTKCLEIEPIQEEQRSISEQTSQNTEARRQEASKELERQQKALRDRIDKKERASEEYGDAQHNYESGDDLDDFDPAGTMKRKQKEINSHAKAIADIHNTVVLDPAKHISAKDVRDGKISHDEIKTNVQDASSAIKASNELSDKFMSQFEDDQETSTASDKDTTRKELKEKEKAIVEKLPSVEKSIFEKLFDSFLDFFDSGDIASAKNALKNSKNEKSIADALKSLSQDQRIDVINHVIIEIAPRNHLSSPTPTESMKETLKAINSILPANEQVKFLNYKVVKA